MFGVNQATVRRWVDDGQLVGFKHPGGHWRFRWVDILVLLDRVRKDG
jgi:predicted site-specific integrase-resolvase